MITEEQARGIKVQLIEQIESSFPEDRKQFAISQIESMDPEDLESFLVKNGLVGGNQAGQTSQGKCVFCSIIFSDISSYKIAENRKAIAVLEINPVARGHTIIIPKEHIIFGKNIPKEISGFAKKVSVTMKKRLSAEKISVSASNVLGHEIINLVPQYAGQENKGERKRASIEDLEELQKILTKKSFSGARKVSPQKPKEKKEIRQENREETRAETRMWLPKRIP